MNISSHGFNGRQCIQVKLLKHEVFRLGDAVNYQGVQLFEEIEGADIQSVICRP